MLSKCLSNKWAKKEQNLSERREKEMGMAKEKERTRSKRRCRKSQNRKAAWGLQQGVLPGRCTEKAGVQLEDEPGVHYSSFSSEESQSFI